MDTRKHIAAEKKRCEKVWKSQLRSGCFVAFKQSLYFFFLHFVILLLVFLLQADGECRTVLTA